MMVSQGPLYCCINTVTSIYIPDKMTDTNKCALEYF